MVDGIVKLHELLELVGQLRAVLRLAARERVALEVMRVRDVVDARHQRR